MNHWLEEELTRQTFAERQRELAEDRLMVDFNALEIGLSFPNRVILRLGEWLIASGEKLRRRHEGATSVSAWVNKRNFAR